MTFGLAITILLALLDYTGKANFTLFQIFLPMIIEFSVYVVIWALVIVGAITVGTKANRDAKRARKARARRNFR